MKNKLIIYTGKRQSGVTTRLVKKAAKTYGPNVTLIGFARNKSMREELRRLLSASGVSCSVYVANDSFIEIRDWLDSHPHSAFTELHVIVDDVTPSQLKELMRYSSLGVRVFCGFSNDADLHR